MTPAETAEEIARLYVELADLERRKAAVMERIASLKGDLRTFNRSGTFPGMTAAQERARASAISKSRAKHGGDAFQRAVSRSKWGSANRYARERLGRSPGMLSRWRSGDFAVPDDVAAKILADFGLKIGK